MRSLLIEQRVLSLAVGADDRLVSRFGGAVNLTARTLPSLLDVDAPS